MYIALMILTIQLGLYIWVGFVATNLGALDAGVIVYGMHKNTRTKYGTSICRLRNLIGKCGLFSARHVVNLVHNSHFCLACMCLLLFEHSI